MANRFERSIAIDAPASRVFDYIADLEHHGEWATNPLIVTLDTSGPIRVGTEFHSGAKIGGNHRDRGRVTHYEPPSRFEFETEGSAGTVRNWYSIASSGTGCVLTKGSHNTRLSLFSRLMIPVLAVIAPPMYDRNLRAIKETMEANGVVAEAG